MTFDFTAEQLERQTRARGLAKRLTAAAAAIDAGGAVPSELSNEIAALDLQAQDPATRFLMLEELAVASPAAAARLGLGDEGEPSDLAGLKGVRRVAKATAVDYLTMAAICVGLGRAALDEALAAARQRGDRPAGEPGDPPHWALADAATELDGARLLAYAAATGRGLPPAAAMAHAAAAASRAVDAAIRIVGPAAYVTGGRLERCARDARAAWLVLGAEDDTRRLAADALLSGDGDSGG